MAHVTEQLGQQDVVARDVEVLVGQKQILTIGIVAESGAWVEDVEAQTTQYWDERVLKAETGATGDLMISRDEKDRHGHLMATRQTGQAAEKAFEVGPQR